METLTHSFFLLHIFLKLNGTFEKTSGANVPKSFFLTFGIILVQSFVSHSNL